MYAYKKTSITNLKDLRKKISSHDTNFFLLFLEQKIFRTLIIIPLPSYFIIAFLIHMTNQNSIEISRIACYFYVSEYLKEHNSLP